MTTKYKKETRDVLFSTRMTADEARRVDETLKRLNEDVGTSGRRITRSTITRMGIEMLLAQAAAH